MTEGKQDIIKVSEKDLDGLLGLDIVAFQFAEGGAMGYHGGVFFVTADGNVYFTCYLKPSDYSGIREYMSWKNLTLVFPPLKEFSHYIANINVVVPRGFEYEYLGAGNHLLVKQELWEGFLKEAEHLHSEHPECILYNLWTEAILRVLETNQKS